VHLIPLVHIYCVRTLGALAFGLLTLGVISMAGKQLIFPIIAAQVLVFIAAEPLRVSLQKRTLDLKALNVQHSLLRQRFLGARQNGGDDIPLLDFMDAQVCTFLSEQSGFVCVVKCWRLVTP
jgi:hypothetical protein